MNRFQRAVVLLLGSELGGIKQHTLDDLSQELGGAGLKAMSGLLRFSTIDLKSLKEPDVEGFRALLRTLLAQVNPGPASLLTFAGGVEVSGETTVYLVLRSWDVKSDRALAEIVREIHAAGNRRSIEVKVSILLLLPGCLGPERIDDLDVDACRAITQLEDLYFEVEDVPPWGDNPPIDSIWLVDGVNSVGQDILEGSDSIHLAAEVLSSLLSFGYRFPPAETIDLSTERTELRCYRALGITRVSVPRDDILLSLGERFAHYLIERRIVGESPTYLEELAIATKKLLRGCLDVTERISEISIGQDGPLLPPFTPEIEEEVTGTLYLRALSAELDRHTDIFESSCQLLYSVGDEVVDQSLADLWRRVANEVDGRLGGTRYAIALLETALDEAENSELIDDKRRQTPAFTFHTLRRDLAASVHCSLGVHEMEASLSELEARESTLQAEISELEQDLKNAQGTENADEPKEVNESAKLRAETEARLALLLAELKDMSMRKDEVEQSLDAFTVDEGDAEWDMARVSKAQKDLFASDLESISEDIMVIEDNIKEAIQQRDQVLGIRRRIALWDFLILPAGAAIVGLALLTALAVSGVAPLSRVLTSYVARLVVSGVLVTALSSGAHYVWRVVWRISELTRLLGHGREQMNLLQLRALAVCRAHLEKLFHLRVVERVGDVISAAERWCRLTKSQLQEFYNECYLWHEKTENCNVAEQGPTRVMLLPRESFGRIFDRISGHEIAELEASFLSAGRAKISSRAMGTDGNAGELVKDAVSFAMSEFDSLVDDLGIEDLLTLPEHEALREECAISWEGVASMLAQVFPFAQVSDIAGRGRVKISRLVGGGSEGASPLHDNMASEEFAIGRFAHGDRFSFIGIAATELFSREHLNSPRC